MAFVGRSYATLRDTLLGYLRTRYAALGVTLSTVQGSDAYLTAEALGVLLEGLEAQGEAAVREILPDTASTSGLNRHGGVDGVPRKAAAATTLTVAITGTPGATVTFGTAVLLSTVGISYRPDPLVASVVLDGGGAGSVSVTSTTTGAGTVLAVAAVLTWSTTPTNANATGAVSSVDVAGVDAETDTSYAARIIARRRDRPASGNRADWRQWCLDASATVVEAYVYSLLQPGDTSGQLLGCVTTIPLGPATGDSVTDTRKVGAGVITTCQQYVEGTGLAPLDQQRRPVTMIATDYSIEAHSNVGQEVVATVTTSGLYAYPWAGPNADKGITCNAGSTLLGETITMNFAAATVPAGANVVGSLVAVGVGAGLARGGYAVCKVVAGGTTGTITIDRTAVAPAGLVLTAADVPNATFVYPAPANYQAMRLAVFAVYDALGPGDTTDVARRWPTADQQGAPTLYRSKLVAALEDVPGVLDVTVGTPAANVVPAAKHVVLLSILTLRQP